MNQGSDGDEVRRPRASTDDDMTVSSGGSASTAYTQSAAAGHVGNAAGESRPTGIPGYRILGLLGRGGMGVVWEAEQERPRRRVALKVMRRDHQVDEVHARMFHREAETLARLEHPNIAAIYESGHTDDGHDYFAMELVAGQTLDQWLAGRPETVDRAELKLRLRLFGAICDGVHYAHQRGVIHRDLKPSNIVVTEGAGSASGGSPSGAGPTVKILDFGLARITDSDIAATLVSEIGTIRGTLQYMSPEQARGDVATIDVRSDVYSLGVILYELLAGRRPYDVSRAVLAEAVRVICEDRPAPLTASRIGGHRLDPDLGTIAGKALEKEVERRYGSAAALGEDVERYLTSQPILARPPSAVYQLRKFAVRNRALVGAAATVVLALVAAAAVSTTFGLREAAQRREAELARTDLEQVVAFQSRMLATVDPAAMGRAMIDDLHDRVVAGAREAGASEAEANAKAATFDDLVRLTNATDAALRVIDDQVLTRALTAVDAEFERQPEIALQLRATIAGTYGELGLLDQAEAQRRAVYDASQQERGPDDPRTLDAGYQLAQELSFLGRNDDAEALVTDVLERQRRVAGDTDPATLRSRTLLAVLEQVRGKDAEAESAYQEILAEQRRTLGVDHQDTMATMNLLAMLYSDEGRAEAEPLMLELLGSAQHMWGEEDPRTLVYEHNLARIYQRLGRDEEGIERNRHVLAVRSRVLGDDHPRTLRTKASLADSLSRLGRFQEARDLFAEVYADRLRTLGPDHPDTVESIGSLAVETKYLGRFDDAEPLYREALAGRTRLLGAEHPLTLATKYGLADLYLKAERFGDAERLFNEVIADQEKVLGAEHRQTLRSKIVLAGLYEKMQRFLEAERLFVDTSAAQVRSLGEADPESLAGLAWVAEFYIRRGRLDDAERYATRGLELATRALGEDNPRTLNAIFDLAWIRTKQERYQEAEALYLKVLAVQERTLGRDHVDTANTLQNLACVYRDSGRYDDARALFEEVEAIKERAYGPDHPWLVDNLEDYAKLLRMTGETRSAEQLEARVRAINAGAAGRS